MHRTAVLNVVGLTPELLARAPRLSRWAAGGATAAIRGVLPAVTCSVQATYLTGVHPERHGIVGNGWYFREEGEVKFWRQSNRLVQAPKLWEKARALDPAFTCANLFWWFNRFSTVDYAITPLPIYTADGRKIPDIATRPPGLRDALQERLGRFPLFDFWGPRAGLRSSEWIVEAARHVETRFRPTLTLVYLPHLDYNLQRLGPDDPAIRFDIEAIDALAAELVRFYEERGVRAVVLSEYGIVRVSEPVHVNRALRQAGLIEVREELGREALDAGSSPAFAVADHQVAHVYLNDPSKYDRVREILEALPGVEAVLDRDGKARARLDHPRAGDLVAVARRDAWFTYYYWLDDRRAPDFARTVDIHRKPGYDPAELFVDPRLPAPGVRIACYLLRQALGCRALLEVVPLDASLVRGSHGRLPDRPEEGPLFITRQSHLLGSAELEPTEVSDRILRHLTDD